MSGDEIVAMLIAQERELLRPATRADQARVAALIADDFMEIGARGAVFGKTEVLGSLPVEQGIAFEAGPMRVVFMTADVARLHYLATRLVGGAHARSLRTSLWRREADGRWRMAFHQGTPDTGAGTI